MASQDLTLVIKAQNQTAAAFAQMSAGLNGVAQTSVKAAAATEEWGNAQQRAAQKMERMHETALKMNASLTQTNDKAALMAATLGQVSSTASASAAALGMPIGPLTTMNSLLPVVATGWKTMTTAAVGFNTASIGAAGAGLAVGAALGTMARELGENSNALGLNTKALDANIAKLLGYKTAADEAAGAQAAFTAKIRAINIASAATRGEVGPGLGPNYDDRAKAEEKFYSESKQRAEQAARERIATAQRVAAEESKFWQAGYAAMEKALDTAQKNITKIAEQESEERIRIANIEAKAIADEYLSMQKEIATTAENYSRILEAQLEAQQEGLQEQAELWANIGEAIGIVGGIFQAFGVDADSVLGRITSGLAGLANTASSVFSKLASGDTFGAITSGIGGIVGFVTGLFGGGSKDKKAMEDLKKQFLEAQGGLDALKAKAREAGVSLDALFDAKKAKEMEKAIDDITKQLESWEEAQEKTLAAMDKYGISIDQMGTAFSQLQLDKQFGELFEAYSLLTAAGADVALVNEKMAADVNAYIQTSIRAGAEIPEAMRPILESMLAQGLLTDEAGNKLSDLSGITFAESITDSVNRITDAIMSLVDALNQGINSASGLGNVLGNIRTIGPSGGQFIDPTPKPTAGGGWFPYRPGGYVRQIGEAGNEAVLNERQILKLVEMGAARGGAQGGPAMQISVRLDASNIPKAMIAKTVVDEIVKNTRGTRERLRLSARGGTH